MKDKNKNEIESDAEILSSIRHKMVINGNIEHYVEQIERTLSEIEHDISKYKEWCYEILNNKQSEEIEKGEIENFDIHNIKVAE